MSLILYMESPVLSYFIPLPVIEFCMQLFGTGQQCNGSFTMEIGYNHQQHDKRGLCRCTCTSTFVYSHLLSNKSWRYILLYAVGNSGHIYQSWDMDKNVVGLNQLIGLQPYLFDNWFSNSKFLQILYINRQ